MTEQETEKRKKQRNKIRVSCNWENTAEISPQFKQLLSLLLRVNNGGKDGDRRERIEGTERQDADLL